MNKKYRRSTITVHTEVDVDIDDVLGDLTNEEIAEECTRRGMVSPTGKRDDLADAYEALMRNDPEEAALVLHAILFPRFKSPADALTKLQAHKGEMQ